MCFGNEHSMRLVSRRQTQDTTLLKEREDGRIGHEAMSRQTTDPSRGIYLHVIQHWSAEGMTE